MKITPQLFLTCAAAIVSAITIIHPASALKMPAIAGLAVSLDMRWGNSLQNMVSDGRLKLEDFEKIDFTNPYGEYFTFFESDDDRVYKFFSKKSAKFHAFGGPIDPSSINMFTTKDVEPIFNIRRVQTPEKIRDMLVVIIPDFDVKNCSGTPAESSPENPFRIAPDNHEIVIDPIYLEGCIRTGDKKVYWILPLIGRTKRPDSDIWTLH